MADPELQETLLLGCFAQFYEEVARIRQAWAAGTLPDLLAAGGKAPVLPDELARSVSARLLERLDQQSLELQRQASEAQLRAYATSSYVMVVLADEIFILEMAWPARSAWLDVLLEYRQFSSRQAGRRFFELADALLQSGARSGLNRDLAACFLLALQLGFKGRHRGPQGVDTLDRLRSRLYRFVNGSELMPLPERLFTQAYEHTMRSGRDERIAPIRPWLRLSLAALAGFLLVSSMLWLWQIAPLLRAAPV